jgi:hypothetical protein
MSCTYTLGQGGGGGGAGGAPPGVLKIVFNCSSRGGVTRSFEHIA